MGELESEVSIVGTVGYEARDFKAGGIVASGYLVREEAHLWMRRPSPDRHLKILIRRFLSFPDLIASLALQPPDREIEAESEEEFTERMTMRINLAKALEEAASRIRQAPRK